MSKQETEGQFIQPTFAEYQALVKLRKAGFEAVYVEFNGAGDHGVYEDIECSPPDKNTTAFRKELKLLQGYFERNLDDREDFSFDNEGCVGTISICLKENEFTMTFETRVPVWMEDVYVEENISPSTNVEKLAAESSVES